MRLNLDLTRYPLFGTDIKVELHAHHYENGRVALQLMSEMKELPGEMEPFSTATINIPEEDLAPEEIYVKGYSENENMEEWLLDNGLVEPCPLDSLQTGHTQVNKYRMSEKLLSAIANALVEQGGRSRR